ncbi:MAG: bifunctional alpha,alpha-trehalose-phosphate synthase (UDP-forming)/trehalose-phosphatase [Bacteroidota bacterium]
MAKTLIVSNRLPVKISKNEEGELSYMPSEGGLATGLGSIYKEGGNIWIGWPGLYLDDEKEQTKVKEGLSKNNMSPVFLTEKEIKDYYEGFSNETLWPNFHYFNQYCLFDDDHWEEYKRVNQKFTNAILEHAEANDTIWVHDYQLLLVPSMVRKERPDMSIGFFQHIPFPSYESFRILPYRREILCGMLGADLIGFHTYDDMRHFLSSVSRLAGYSNSRGEIEYRNRKIYVDAFPMGIDYDKYASTAASPETLEREVRYRTSMGDQKIILSIDRLDYSKGIPQRLRAFEVFLETYPEYVEKVSLLMVVVPSRDNVEKYKRLKEEIDELVGRINGNFSRISWSPIYYYYRSFPLEALSAFYRMAKVALVTPLRDGMNLVCKEYIASKLDQKGVLILSEMAGSSKELSDAILINPTDQKQLVEALHRALTMSEEEQIKHISIMQKSLKRYNIFHWVDLFMKRLSQIKEEQKSHLTQQITEEVAKGIVKDYKSAQKRLIFLDYDGTLVSFHDDPNDSKPDENLIQTIEDLTSDEANKVVIISGRDKETLGGWLGHLKLDFITEHGVWLREYGSDWRLKAPISGDWKEEIRELLESYVNRTPGSFIEEKNYSLVWHYRKVETGLDELRTREITSHLKFLSQNRNLQVLEGDKVIEIKSSEVDKGKAATLWLSDEYDFVFAAGDDWTDEDTFEAMPEDAYTIKVGNKSTAAHYRCPSNKELRELLLSFTKW